MAKSRTPQSALLRWTEYVSTSDVQDPLGLGLRGSTRLASQLLYCITSITPRARYFSFIPWSVLDFQKREQGKPFALGLMEAIKIREKGLALGCIAHHDGHTCEGGGLVGSTRAAAWYEKGRQTADLKQIQLTKNPAWDAYFNSLVNLGFFVTEDERPDEETETKTEVEQQDSTFDELELSTLGVELASRYDSLVSDLPAVRQVSSSQRRCSVKHLAQWGKAGGLCELREDTAPDREWLRDIFFARTGSKGKSHGVRKHSLLLILDLARQLNEDDWLLTEPVFASAVYYGQIASGKDRLDIEWPKVLLDNSERWRMFYFHHFMAVALEAMFSWIVTQIADKGVRGDTVEQLVSGMNKAVVKNAISQKFKHKLGSPFGQLTPAKFFSLAGGPLAELGPELSRQLDSRIGTGDLLAEDNLEEVIRSNAFLYSPSGLAIPMVLLTLTLGRYAQWESSNYGNWLAKAARDPYVDMVPPVLTNGLARRFGDWWTCPFADLTQFILSRYVIQQHQAMSYEKSAAGTRCLLQVDGDNVISTAAFEKIGMGNPRLRSAIQILTDLALLDQTDEGVILLTNDGRQLLQEELAKEADQ
jgi:hypothetical protein